MNQQQRIALFVLVLAGFVTIFDLFVVNVAIVSIERGLQASFTELTLIIAGYELAFGLLLITGGRLGDIYGRRRLYQAGMAFFYTRVTVVCCRTDSLITGDCPFYPGTGCRITVPAGVCRYSPEF
ncbi:MFS transporter [Morganella morganii]|nr:MFS transporter [Morganella morganii]